MGILSINGTQYYYLLKDDATSYCFVHFSAKKDEAFSFFKRIFRIVQRDTSNIVEKFRIDNGTEYINGSFQAFLTEHAIQHDTSTVYTPQQNGYIN